jgi:hypothetical protein
MTFLSLPRRTTHSSELNTRGPTSLSRGNISNTEPGVQLALWRVRFVLDDHFKHDDQRFPLLHISLGSQAVLGDFESIGNGFGDIGLFPLPRLRPLVFNPASLAVEIGSRLLPGPLGA